MTDHKTEAEALMGRTNQSGFAIDPEGALVHATLYLAEQQRIANLLTAYQAEGWLSVEDVIAEPWESIRKQIVEGLGI